MKYINLKSFRNRNELKKSIERDYFDKIYKDKKHYKESMEMLELSFDIEPNMGRNERFCFVNGLTTSRLIIDKLSNIEGLDINDNELLNSVIMELESEEKSIKLDEYQKEYFRYGVFSAILLKSNENAKEVIEQQKMFQKIK